MAGSPALSNDLGHLVDLSLRTAESTESLLCELARALVLAVAEEFDDAALVGCEAVGWWLVHRPYPGEVSCCGCGSGNVPSNLLDNVSNESGSLAEMSLHARHSWLWLPGSDFLYGGRSC